MCDLNEITGCMDPEADNYQEYFTDPGNCWYLGCTNPTALNYDPEATQYQQNSCIFEEFELDWNYNYTVEKGCFPVENLIEFKKWPTRNRIDNILGDKKLIKGHQ